MKRAAITPIASLFLFVAGSVLASSVAPKKGVSTCKAGTDCSWPVGRETKTESGRDSGNGNKDQIKTSAAKALPSGESPPWDSGAGNLPTYLKENRRAAPSEGSVVIVPDKVTGAMLAGLRAGDILPAEIEQSIKASPTVPTPIRARITAGRFHGGFLLGTATLDRELKRVLLVFERMRLQGNDTTYQLRGSGLALNGQVGLEGDHHTQEGVYFAAELGAAAAAGYADATTSRTQSVFGGYQTEPSASNAAKQGAVQALSKTAERFAERARTAPEYTEIEGGQAIQIIIEQSPTEVTGG